MKSLDLSTCTGDGRYIELSDSYGVSELFIFNTWFSHVKPEEAQKRRRKKVYTRFRGFLQAGFHLSELAHMSFSGRVDPSSIRYLLQNSLVICNSHLGTSIPQIHPVENSVPVFRYLLHQTTRVYVHYDISSVVQNHLQNLQMRISQHGRKSPIVCEIPFSTGTELLQRCLQRSTTTGLPTQSCYYVPTSCLLPAYLLPGR